MSVGKLDVITGGDLMLQIGGSLLLNGRVRLGAIVLPGATWPADQSHTQRHRRLHE